ncbi:GTP 3',8-cyclase MoaA [Pleionea sediminis]|uniref:GTP 3',8-cyclase MoaA n=1 Tax=Pleionea sediminis TaxID=2569479 RepID=UPI00197C1F43|nr:GTP 3',8-cyclase MoaA [Pleionea sediminis]
MQSTSNILQDGYGREFHYLRLSVTDVCNFKCNYCLPDGYQKAEGSDCHSALSLDEIRKIVHAFAKLGTKKVRITGGEPSLRKDLADIIAVCKNTPGIESVALTTNGYKLPQKIESWIAAGLDRLNVSIDSLDPRMFKTITGHDRLNEILQGIEIAQQCGLKKIKINAVLLRQFNHQEFSSYLQWLKDKDFTLRFIELMQTGDNKQFFQDNHVSGECIKEQLLTQGWTRIIRSQSAGPAQEFQHSDYQGRIGLIMPYSKDFCKSCNRLRISSQGKLHLCLFGELGLPLRHLCDANDTEQLQQQIRTYVAQKEVSHYLHQGNSGLTRHLAMLGG